MQPDAASSVSARMRPHRNAERDERLRSELSLAVRAALLVMCAIACGSKKESHDEAANVEIIVATPERSRFDTSACAVVHDARCVRCALASNVEAQHYEALAQALALVPRSFVEASAVKRVVLCNKLSGPDTTRGATIDPARGALLLKIEVLEKYAVDVLHHEMFHMFDITAPTHDTAWVALNPAGFRYGARDRAPRGFVRAYSTTNAREDKATVYEAIITKKLCKTDDDVVLAKARLVRERIRAAIGEDAKYIDKLAPCLAE